ncbi:hypothetical protein [Rhizobium lusitanum]|uniref:Uncharacterized protein n=1 Tax=Rhizobium lusitanum TaxID=293958 RepID=A0A7X0MH61_9HYPH|nr:hypothetical protein [Rhizobium lusitanum]MBB6488768.1 hypothetical protein [Rhizobium lusitanum]
MTSDDRIIRDYLQAAHNRGGSFEMAMGMLVQRIMVLEDRLQRARISFDADPVIVKLEREALWMTKLVQS